MPYDIKEIPALKLKKAALRRRATGHMWIFSNELENVDSSVPPGTICRVFTPDGGIAGEGFFNYRSLISVRLLTDGKVPPEENFLEKRLAAAAEYRKKLGIEYYCRLCFGESDGLPGLVVDRYKDIFVIEIMSAGMELLKDRITEALVKLFSPAAVYYKNSHQYRQLEGLESYEETAYGTMPDEISVEENGLTYRFPAAGAQKTGWYYDQRENRKMLEPYFKGRKVLDLHTYMGAFALTAARAGAEAVWGIDSSEKSVDCATGNAAANGLVKNVIFRREKAENVLYALERGELPERPDFILLDPPNLVRNKKSLPQALKMLGRMCSAAFRSLPEGGLLAVSTCSQHIKRDDLLRACASAAGRRQAVLLELGQQAKDHPVIINMPETEYLHFALFRVK